MSTAGSGKPEVYDFDDDDPAPHDEEDWSAPEDWIPDVDFDETDVDESAPDPMEEAWDEVPPDDWADGGWAELDAAARTEGVGDAAEPWAADEVHSVPPDRLRVGVEERVGVVGQSGLTLLALLDTGAPGSCLRGRMEEGGEGLWVDGHRLPVRPAGDPPVVRLTIQLGAVRRSVCFRVLGPSSGTPVVLGRDALAGSFMVDPAERGLAGKPVADPGEDSRPS